MVGTLVRRPPVVSAFMQTMLDDADAGAALATLGVAYGSYTPTLTHVLNIDASTVYQARYIKVGSVVAVAGRLDVDATTAATASTLFISLPIASDFVSAANCGGTFNVNGSAGGVISGNVGSNVAEAFWPAGTTINAAAGYSFMYTVL